MTWDYYDIRKEEENKGTSKTIPQKKLLSLLKDANDAKKTGQREYFDSNEKYLEFTSAIDKYLSILNEWIKDSN